MSSDMSGSIYILQLHNFVGRHGQLNFNMRMADIFHRIGKAKESEEVRKLIGEGKKCFKG
jgi:hypothetical protein